MKNLANTNIVHHADRYLALWEAGPPTEVTLGLDTVSLHDFGGRLDGAFTAHPTIDPRTGEMLAFAYLPFEPYLRYLQVGVDGAMDREGADADPGLPTRFTVDTGSGTVGVEQFDDMGGDFPRINDAYCGVRSRYHYMGGFRGAADVIGHFDTIVRYDDHTGARATWFCGDNVVTSEASFAADPDGTAEDDGCLLAFLSDRTDGATEVAVLDARDVAAGPIARVRLPRRVPFGFHVNWFPSST